MEQDDMKKCPYCAEMIRAGAVKCRWCGSTISAQKSAPGIRHTQNYWHRVNNGKRVAGVCTGIAREFNAPKLILPLRLFFVLTTIFYGFGFILYIVLWLLMPSPVDASDHPANQPDKGSAPRVSQEEAGHQVYRKKVDPASATLGFLLLAVGIVLILFSSGSGRFEWLPFRLGLGLPHFLHDAFFFNINWITGLWPLLIFVGLIILFFGAMKAIRITLGCGLIAAGALFLMLFIPFLPGALAFPGLIIIGILLAFIGGLKLLFGSSKVVHGEAEHRNSYDSEGITENDWDRKE